MSRRFKMEIRKSKSVERGKYRPYSVDDLTDAYNIVKEQDVPIERAAKMYGVPITTLKDRVKGRINIDTVKSGPQTMFSQVEEAFLAQHLTTMAEIGYGYSRQESINLASDYAVHLGLKNNNKPLSITWLYSFLERWPSLKVKKPRSLEIARAKSATRPVITRYFHELDAILSKYHLKDQPSRIYNIDEKGLNLEHKPPKIITGANYKAQAITAGKSNTVTVIGGGNALSQQIPPYFIFPGTRMLPSLMEGATPGSVGTVSESGWSNTEIFTSYMTEHLAPLLPSRTSNSPVLVLYDGHRSHVSLGLIEWARSQNIILFVLPPHCSHLLQPMDVSCYAPFEVGWNAACHQYLRESGGRVVTRYEVSRIASKVYTATLSPVNIQSAFRRCGIYPFNPDVVSDTSIAPSLCFKTNSETATPSDVAAPVNSEGTIIQSQTTTDAREFLIRKGSSLLQNVPVAKVRKTLSKVVGGKPITEDIIYDQVKKHISGQKQPKPKQAFIPVAGTSGISTTKKSKSQVVPHSESDSDENDLPDSEKCVVCKRHNVKDLDKLPYLNIVNWGCCDRCDRWVHLKFCSPVRVLRRNDTFLCPSCSNEQ